jgi:hypothetical protein
MIKLKKSNLKKNKLTWVNLANSSPIIYIFLKKS